MHLRSIGLRRVALVSAAALALAAASAAPVAADQSNHTEYLPVWVTSDGMSAGYPSPRAGHVVNIHTSGPTVFALERYQLNGAAPDTTFSVVLQFNAGSCSGDYAFLFANGATLTTDAAGNAHARVRITPQEVADFGLHNTSWGITGTFVDDAGVAAYSTACANVYID